MHSADNTNDIRQSDFIKVKVKTWFVCANNVLQDYLVIIYAKTVGNALVFCLFD